MRRPYVAIRFFATVNQGLAGGQQLVNTALARADNVSPINSNSVHITIGTRSVIASALKVRTGAGGTIALSGFGAMLASAGYLGRRRILGAINLI